MLCKLYFCKCNILLANTIDMIRNKRVDKTDSVIISIMNDLRDVTGCWYCYKNIWIIRRTLSYWIEIGKRKYSDYCKRAKKRFWAFLFIYNTIITLAHTFALFARFWLFVYAVINWFGLAESSIENITSVKFQAWDIWENREECTLLNSYNIVA